ncbi:response regulator transcription factor [Siminovitchia sp. FSL H7-0308]|uniref:DNA-binding NarL/FixJ family response regulator n=1 Tax=Siminovitchia thermophila TaxID=1245522 RepID=A0ABS2R530_9BACI|nr:response regulator transcription factor [Siminovitchia thermophila]MBM7714732.1 DNA-binding NarL/FixJ family response regulator [Siminovitchia thermophila]ONK24497.1 DNA-binding response regulator [Bacillus sp. VT-16-64]
MIKVLLVDDHVLIRKGIGLLLTKYQDIEVVGEASDGAEAIQLAEQLRPNVILMDISIPKGIDGFTSTIEIKKHQPDIKVIMLTMHNELAYIRQAIEVGADGYILKNSQGGEMYQAIQAVYTGRNFYEVGLPEEQIEKLYKQKGKKKADILSTREQEILRLTVLGYSNIQIADQLFISTKTVENHKSNIMQKLNVKTKAELIQYGIANDYIK